MRQATYTLVFEDPDQTTFTTEMKAKTLQVAPSAWYETLIYRLSPVVRQDIHEVEQSIADLGESDKFQERTL